MLPENITEEVGTETFTYQKLFADKGESKYVVSGNSNSTLTIKRTKTKELGEIGTRILVRVDVVTPGGTPPFKASFYLVFVVSDREIIENGGVGTSTAYRALIAFLQASQGDPAVLVHDRLLRGEA